MKLPRGDVAIVDGAKLRDYLLSPIHPRGRHKARVFLSVLGLGPREALLLLAWLRQAAATADADRLESDRFGTRYRIDAEMVTVTGRAMIRSTWLLPVGGGPPRFITAYIVR